MPKKKDPWKPEPRPRSGRGQNVGQVRYRQKVGPLMKRARRRSAKVALSLTCSECGEPLSKTSVDFGMDCVNDCGRRTGKPTVVAGVKPC